MFWPLSVHYILRAERSLISNFLPLIKIHQKYFSISWVGGDIPHVQSAEDWREMETPNLCKSEIKQTLEKHRGHTATKSVIKTNTNNPRGRNFRNLWYDTRADDKISYTPDMLHEVDMGTKVCGDGFCGPFYRRGRRLTENDQLIEQIDGTKAIISSLFAPVFVLIEPQRSCLQLCALS